MRYTEYHCGKAVIKDREQLPAAMQKMDGYEDAERGGGLISRKALLDALSHFNDCENGNEHYLNAIRTVEEIVRNMPAAGTTEDDADAESDM